jgi:predicted MFS family arabinose efflux permease
VHAPPGRLSRYGLVAVAISTLAMGVTSNFAAWLVWRFAAGVASALVLIGTAAWTLHRLAAAQRPQWAGGVFAGVGVGIAFAGALVLAVTAAGAPVHAGWSWLGAAAAVVTVLTWRALAADGSQAVGSPSGRRMDADAWRLVVCYAAFGFGYIVPATYLPVMAQRLLDDPAQIGLVWPVFGLAAAVSTVATSLLLRNVPPRLVWAGGHFVMAIGVAASAFGHGVAALLVGAVCVGGTFMIVTMAGLQEARRVGRESGTKLMAAMTASFAVGQLAGPIVVAALSRRPDPLALAGAAASLFLLASTVVLVATSGTKKEQTR